MKRTNRMSTTWARFAADLPRAFARLKPHFPHLDPLSMPRVARTRATFEAYLADRHDLTLIEAREMLDDFLARFGRPDPNASLPRAA